MTSCLRILLVLSLCLMCRVGFGADEVIPVFEDQIRPLLAKKCGSCHGDTVRKAGLDLSSMPGLIRGGESGESVYAETADDSLLWIMVDGGGMPPEDQPQLTEEELRLIRRWIETGTTSRESVAKEAVNQHDVLPILLLRCTACHGRQYQRGGLDMRTIASIREGGNSGSAIVPGDAGASLMIERIESEACPPRELLLKFFVRRPPASEIRTLREWIDAGAPEVDIAPDVATTEPDPLVTDEDRQHWAFQSPQGPFDHDSIDGFIEAKLSEHELEFSPIADRDTFIRRAYLDLTGLPPSIEEWKRWRSEEDANWYARMIDFLLASPHYGERWGRYWLDLAGYADSEGGVSADPVREVAWKYRDYVVQSFNEDKPYDQFLIEQLAGDELIDYESAESVSEEMVENLIATGFLRMGIDQTGSRTMNFVPERLGVVGDAITIVSSGLMGLTMECCRCHSHKYDPLPQRDYYRFKAILQGALDEHDWLSFKTRKLHIATDERQRRVEEVNPSIEKELKLLQTQLQQAIAERQLATLKAHNPEQSEDDRQATLTALKVADNTRTLPQRRLVENLQRAETTPASEQPESVLAARQAEADIERRIASARRRLEPSLTIRALWDRGEPSPTYVLGGGEHTRSGQLVGPGVPSVLTDGKTPFDVRPPFPEGTPKSGRRLAFARWLTKPDHPLTSRVIVNRLWHHHFGAGLVKTLDNFGTQGERPSHEQLLDWLAIQFADGGWSIKQIHRLIMNSRTYKQSSRITKDHLTLDPQNRLLSRMPLRRMDAETLRDSMLFVSGTLDSTSGGPPDPVSVNDDGLVTAVRLSEEGWRRSLYLQHRRTEIPTMLQTFDYPVMGPNCLSRNTSMVTPQALLLRNNGRVQELSEAFSTRIRYLAGEDSSDDALIDLSYGMALSRPPSDDERRQGLKTLRELKIAWHGDQTAALTSYCHTLFNAAAFLFID